ncbi:MAG: TetR/AcrR family transcriptional regulator [Clostridia bacterium]|nr:TetR/AcrR family transcriptional regulator [Clostridia bacterium]
MPKDKTATHEKLVPIVKQEFLRYGYEKASVNRIAEAAGMSAAGLYRHYRDKEDMFASLVGETLAAFDRLCRTWQNGSLQSYVDYDPFGMTWTGELLDYVYTHFDGLKLLICCSAGSKYGDFEDQLILKEEISSKEFAKSRQNAGARPISMKDEQWHLVATLYVKALMEIIRHDMPREKAEEHIAFIKEFLYPGMKKLYGL